MPLQGHHVLVIEDEPLISLDLEGALVQAGARSVSVAATVEAALAGVRAADITTAVVDLRLNGQSVRDAVRVLVERELPFVFYSGLEATPTAASWPKVPLLTKPLPPEDVVNTLVQVVAAHRRGNPT